MKNTIRKKWIITTVVFTAVLLLITAVFLLPGTKQPAEDTAAERIVAVNEVQQLIRRGEDEQAALKLQALKEKMQDFVKADLPIIKYNMNTQDASARFREMGRMDKVRLYALSPQFQSQCV